MAGYSGKPLADKLGIKANYRLGVFDAPPEFDKALGQLPEGVVRAAALRASYDVALVFAKDKKSLEKRFEQVAKVMTTPGALWVSWPKKSSGIVSELDENAVRAIGLARGFVDVKVCAIDETWSGLKFVVRVSNRE